MRGLLTLALLLAVSTARADPAAGQLAPLELPAWGDGSAGPSCAYFSTMGPLPWPSGALQWRDANGRVGGEAAFGRIQLRRGAGRPFVEMDLKGLSAAHAEAGELTLVLRSGSSSTSDVAEFHSRESADRGARPVLKWLRSDGSRERLTPQADTYLDCSSLASLGQQGLLKVGGSRVALLRFRIPKGAPLRQASLLLSSDQQYGAALVPIAAFVLEAPSFSKATPLSGLAARHPGDRGLAKEPEVWFTSDFESSTWWTDFGLSVWRGHGETVAHAPGFQPLDGRALKVVIPRGKNLGLDMRYNFPQPPEEAYFRYYLWLDPSWKPDADGGKLPGFASTQGQAGWGRRKSDGVNGWSLRGGFARRPVDDPAVRDWTAMSSYVYHPEMVEQTGDVWGWSGAAGVGLLKSGRWYCIEQHVRLNTPGRKDGLFEAWVDGRMVLRREQVRLRDVPNLRIESVWFDIYYGGLAPATSDMTLYIDKVVIAQRYIGPAQ